MGILSKMCRLIQERMIDESAHSRHVDYSVCDDLCDTEFYVSHKYQRVCLCYTICIVVRQWYSVYNKVRCKGSYKQK